MASQWATAILASYPAAGSVTAAIPATSPVTVDLGATFDLAGNSATVGSLSGAGNVTLGNSGVLTVSFTTGGSSVFSGAISGSGSLVETGAGLLTLTGNDTYTGGTDIEDGTLEAMSPEAIPTGSGLTVGANGTVDFGDPSGAGEFAVARASSSASPAGVAAVPEPGTLALLSAAGIIAAAAVWRRRRN